MHVFSMFYAQRCFLYDYIHYIVITYHYFRILYMSVHVSVFRYGSCTISGAGRDEYFLWKL
jgi:hypothetical protein